MKDKELKNKELNGKDLFIMIMMNFVIGIIGMVAGCSIGNEIHESANNDYSNTSTNNDEELETMLKSYLKQYIDENSALTEQKNALESEIAALEKQKEELTNNKTYDVKQLLVVEYSFEANKQNLWILNTEYTGTEICDEVFGRFKAWYGLHPEDPNNHQYEVCARYVHLYPENTQPLANYLTDDRIAEIVQNGSRITTTTLREIEEEINAEYNKNIQASYVPTCAPKIKNYKINYM